MNAGIFALFMFVTYFHLSPIRYHQTIISQSQKMVQFTNCS